MGKVLVTESYLEDIADAIREKNGTVNTYTPAEMADAISAISGGGSYNWMGKNVELVNTVHESTTALSSTSYSSWEPSSTATTLKAASNLSKITIDFANYAYILRWICISDVKLKAGAALNAEPVLQVSVYDQCLFRRPSNLTNLESGTHNYNVYVNTTALSWMKYYNTNSALAMAWSSSYGFYSAVQTLSITSTTNDTTTITPKTPTWVTRCSATYFDTSRASDIDGTTSFYLKGLLYRMDPVDSILRQRYDGFIDIINDIE